MPKKRVYELAKELGVDSKVLLKVINDMGEFVRSASSIVEVPVERRLKERFAADDGLRVRVARPASDRSAEEVAQSPLRSSSTMERGPFGAATVSALPAPGRVEEPIDLFEDFGGDADGDLDYMRQQLMDGYTPHLGQRRDKWKRGQGQGPQPSRPLVATAETYWLLDDFEQVFFIEGTPMDLIQRKAALWQATGLDAGEVKEWIDADVYDDEPDLAASLSAAGFTPRQAREKYRLSRDGDRLSVISWVRGRTDQAVAAREFMARIDAVRTRGTGQALG